MIKLTRPLVVFDLETTGADPKTDCITQISGLRVRPAAEGTVVAKPFDFYVNPGAPIPAEIVELNGITNAFLADKPMFKEIAPKILDLFADCDLGGFAVERFDIPVLQAELRRAGLAEIDLAGRKVVDAQKIYHQQEPRRLENALQFYCGRKFGEGEWHRANHDAQATMEILFAMPAKYSKVIDGSWVHLETLDHLIALGEDTSGRFCDPEKKFEWKNGEPAFRFGKHKGRALRDVVLTDRGYLDWLLFKADDFDGEARRIVMDAVRGLHRSRPAKAAV